MKSAFPASASIVKALLLLSLLPSAALAAEGQIEINATCAIQTGCFAGDVPGYPVTIRERGSYRLTSSLVQTQIPGLSSASTAIDIRADGVDLDLAGFTIGCVNPLGGSCSGSAVGILNGGGAWDDLRVANGRVSGMPGDGVDLGGSTGAMVENVRASDNGGNGITVGTASRVENCTVTRSGQSGIFTNGRSVITRNAVSENGVTGIAAISSVVTENSATQNGGAGISGNSSVIRDNHVSGNGGDGITATWQAKVANNVVVGNGGIGLVVSNSAYERNYLNGNAGGTVAGGIDMGGNSCNFAASCP